jgi:hypothetical protein
MPGASWQVGIEAFYVLNGEVLVEAEGASDPLRLGTGAFLFAPRHPADLLPGDLIAVAEHRIKRGQEPIKNFLPARATVIAR